MPDDNEAVISLREVTKSFGSHTVLEDITFDVPKGRITAILGPSGTGKSVLLKTLIGLLKPDRGSVVIEGVDVTTCPERQLYEIRKLFGVLFQDGAMFGSMNLYDNVAFPLREHTRKSESEIRKIVMNGYNHARWVIERNKEAMRVLAEALLEQESLEAGEIKALLHQAGVRRD